MTVSTFIVTGAGRDIGRAIVHRLGGPETFAILHYTHSGAGAEAALAGMRSKGGNGIAIQADFSNDHGVTRFIAEARMALGTRQLNTLILNAAATAPTPLGQTPIEALKAMLSVNVLAPQRVVDAMAGHLADRSAIVALSIAAVRQVFAPSFGFFAATKAAVDVLVKSWAVALGERGIRVNAVAPGVVDANFRSDLLKDDTFRSSLEKDTALGRAGQIEDIASVVAFLVSDEARWITGQIIDASGGWKL